MIAIKTLVELEDYIKSLDVVRYSEQRNYVDGSTRLSEYISRGFISLPRVRELVLVNNSAQSAYKLLNELAWREYWQQTWRVRQDEIFDYFRPLSYEPRQGIPTAISEASTGITALDDGIRELYQTGYIHNHMRMWIAGLLCNVAKCDWKIGAEWMHSYLIDGDYASNHLSWQWVAGSYTGSAYLPQQDNINTYARTVQKNTYLDHPYDYIQDMSIPEQLIELSSYDPHHESQPLETSTTLDEMNDADTLLVYSPWTLDPSWRLGEQGERVLILPTELFAEGHFSQNVISSIKQFSNSIAGLKSIYLNRSEIRGLSARVIHRKDYPGINYWPGTVDEPELLYPNIEPKFYPSFSSFWKQASKSAS